MHRRVGQRDARLRLALFAGVVALLGVAEAVAPARQRTLARSDRWPAASILAVLAGAVGRLAPPVSAARWASRRRLGLLNRLQAPPWPAWAATLVVLDLAVWAQHVVSHRTTAFWRLHRVHHTDPDLDVATGVRFHPLEIALSGVWKAGVVLALGAPAAAVLALEAWLSTGALFTHANVRLPRRVDRALRGVIVTPAAHRLHHRTGEAASHVNFGFGLSAWDRLFGTYDAGEVDGDERLGVGDRWRTRADQRPSALLFQPWRV